MGKVRNLPALWPNKSGVYGRSVWEGKKKHPTPGFLGQAKILSDAMPAIVVLSIRCLCLM